MQKLMLFIPQRVVSVLVDMINPTEKITDFIENMSWNMKMMMYWKALSSVHKIIAVGLMLVVAFFIVCKLFKCNKKCS